METAMADILKFTGETMGDIPVESVLDGARGLTSVLVMGWTKDDEFYGASSTGDAKELLWLVEKFKSLVLIGPLGNE